MSFYYVHTDKTRPDRAACKAVRQLVHTHFYCPVILWCGMRLKDRKWRSIPTDCHHADVYQHLYGCQKTNYRLNWVSKVVAHKDEKKYSFSIFCKWEEQCGIFSCLFKRYEEQILWFQCNPSAATTNKETAGNLQSSSELRNDQVK